jgi:hypothetical protein
MKTDKTKLLKDIEAMKEKLASMEEELNKPEVFKHFPSKGDKYYYYTFMGTVCCNIATNDNLEIDVYKTKEEAEKAYNKAVALEKVKRRIIELQGDWKPDWTDEKEEKYCIHYDHSDGWFKSDCWFTSQYNLSIPYMENDETALIIIKEMEDELKLIFDIT